MEIDSGFEVRAPSRNLPIIGGYDKCRAATLAKIGQVVTGYRRVLNIRAQLQGARNHLLVGAHPAFGRDEKFLQIPSSPQEGFKDTLVSVVRGNCKIHGKLVGQRNIGWQRYHLIPMM